MVWDDALAAHHLSSYVAVQDSKEYLLISSTDLAAMYVAAAYMQSSGYLSIAANSIAGSCYCSTLLH